MPGQIDARIKEVIQRTPQVKSFRLELSQPIIFKAGQFLCVWIRPEDEYKRYLSISNSPTEKGYLEFTKKLTESKFSKLLDTLRPADTVKIQYPFGKFTIDEASPKIAFLSGGIGITPIRGICKYVVDTDLGIDLVLLYANRGIADIAFKEDFELMQKEYARLKVSHVLCEPYPGFACTVGRINAQVIIQEVPDYAERKFYLCGPPAMVESMQGLLRNELGVADKNIVTENFQGYS